MHHLSWSFLVELLNKLLGCVLGWVVDNVNRSQNQNCYYYYLAMKIKGAAYVCCSRFVAKAMSDTSSNADHSGFDVKFGVLILRSTALQARKMYDTPYSFVPITASLSRSMPMSRAKKIIVIRALRARPPFPQYLLGSHNGSALSRILYSRDRAKLFILKLKHVS